MNTKLVKIEDLKENPENPRVIKDDKFRKLVKSIKEFPKMLEIRPIVVNDDMIGLGGNQRLKACREAGLKEVPVISISNLNDQEQKEFIIKDNLSYGEWDWNVLMEGWNNEALQDWGMDTLDFGNIGMIENVNYETEWVGMPEFQPRDETYKLIIHFQNENDRETFANGKEIEIQRKTEMTWITNVPYKTKMDLTSLRYD
jgi:hypothetical protein